MRFVSHDPHFVRRWAVARGLAPVLGPGGSLILAAPDTAAAGHLLSWEEFAGLFTVESMALTYDGTASPGAWAIRRGLSRRIATAAHRFG